MRPGGPILQVERLVKHFPTDRGLMASGAVVHAVDGIDLEIRPGEVLAVVGESGSGKSTLARCVLRLIDPTSGRIVFDGRDVTALKGRQLAGFRQQVQPVFQDPFSSIDPRWRVGRSVAETLDAFSIGTKRRAPGARRRSARPRRPGSVVRPATPARALGRATPARRDRRRARPGAAADRGRRAGLRARRLGAGAGPEPAGRPAARPRARDPVRRARPGRGRAHQPPDRRDVPGEDRRDRPDRAGVPRPAPPVHARRCSRRSRIPTRSGGSSGRLLEGEIPSPIAPPSGCRFRTRCPVAIDRCAVEEPEMTVFGTGHTAACHVARAELEASA